MINSYKLTMPNKTSSKRRIDPPLDFYGVSPTFYMNGSDKNTSWIGCICTCILAVLMGAVTIYYFLIFVRKEDLTVYSRVETSDKFPFIDLKEFKFIAAIRANYPEDGVFRNQVD